MTSTSRKSASEFRPILKRTLKRKPVVRAFEETDIRYLYATHKAAGGTMTPTQYKDDLGTILDLYSEHFIMEAPTPKGFQPVGCVFGMYSGTFITLMDAVWFPWASDRNKLESMTALFNEIRKNLVAVFVSRVKDNDFYLHIAKQGIIRRIGHLNDVYEGEPGIMFQTRAWPQQS